MQQMIRVMGMALALGWTAAAGAHAQARPRAALPTAQDGQVRSTEFSLLGGLATGDADYDLGLALAGTFEWDLVGWPVNLRVDPYFSRHSGDCGPTFGDCSLTLLGAGGSLAYNFPTASGPTIGATPAQRVWYIFGGLGIYRSSVDVDLDQVGLDGDVSSTDLGLQLGGGVKFPNRFRVEVRYLSVEEFSSFPILVGFRF